MNPVPRQTDDEMKKAIADYLGNGGEVTQCPPNKRSEEIDFKGGFYTRRKKKKEEKEE